MRRLTDGGVVHVQITANGSDDDLTRIQTDPNLWEDPFLTA
jgi:hypothetical protein